MYRAFYKPPTGSYEEQFVDSNKLADLPAGAILVIEIKKDGTRKVIEQKSEPTPKEKTFLDIAQRQTEFKHDGGDSPEMYELRKND